MQEFTIASYNIHKGVGTDRRRDPARTARVIAELDADILALQEADRRFGDRMGILDLCELREATGLVPVPVASRGRAHGWHGNLVLVRETEVQDVRQITLPGLEPRGALMVDLRRDGLEMRIIATHLGLLRASRLLQAKSLADTLRQAPARPTLLMGDLNEWRVSRRSSLQPLMLLPAAPQSPVLSFPARFPVLPLDRIYTCGAADVLDIARHDSPLARVASDHLPIRARVRLPRPERHARSA